MPAKKNGESSLIFLFIKFKKKNRQLHSRFPQSPNPHFTQLCYVTAQCLLNNNSIAFFGKYKKDTAIIEQVKTVTCYGVDLVKLGILCTTG